MRLTDIRGLSPVHMGHIQRLYGEQGSVSSLLTAMSNRPPASCVGACKGPDIPEHSCAQMIGNTPERIPPICRC
jgi:hypothetical protein